MIRYQYLSTFQEVGDFSEKLLQLAPPRVGLDVESSSNTDDPELLLLSVPNPLHPIDTYHEINLNVSSTSITVYLLHISKLGHDIPLSLKEVLQCKYIVKIGCDLSGDQRQLENCLGCRLFPTLDLQTIEISRGSRDYSLDSLGEKYLQVGKLAFTHRNTDWSSELSEKQINYAVNDAYLTLGVYEAMFELTPTVVIKEECAENSLLNFLAYSTVFAGKQPPSMKKVLNTIVNNYSPWRKLHPSESRPRAENAVHELIRSGILLENCNDTLSWKDSQYVLPTTESETQLQLLIRHLKRVHTSPMKYDSVVQAFSNTFWSDTPAYARKIRTERAIKMMIHQNIIQLNGKCLIW